MKIRSSEQPNDTFSASPQDASSFRHKAFVLMSMAVLGAFCFLAPVNAFAAATWTGNGLSNNWSDGANWDTGAAPAGFTQAVFNGAGPNGNKPCTLNEHIAPYGISIETGYTGIISQGPFDVTLTNNFTQSSGTFAGGSGTITFGVPGPPPFFPGSFIANFILSGGTFTATSGTMFFKTDFTQSGNSTFAHNSGTVVFDGPNNQAINLTTSPDVPTSVTFNNFTVNTPSILSVSADDTVVVAGTLTLTDGAVSGAGGPATLDAQGDVSIAATFGAGAIAPPFQGGNANMRFSGALDQTYTNAGGTNPGGTWTVDKTSGTVTLLSDLTLAGTGTALALTNGRIITGANTLALTSGIATVTRTNGYVDGNFRKNFSVEAAKSFEVGTANGFSPVTVNVTAGTPADFTVKAVQGPQPNVNVFGHALQRYWTLTATGVTADLTFNYLDPTDIPATATEANFVIFKYDGIFTTPGGSVNTGANTATITGVTSFSDWTLAEPTAPTTEGSTVGGRILDDDGNPVAGVVIRLNGTQNRKTITDAKGNYRFDNVETTGFYTVTPSRANYHFNPFNRSFSQIGNHTEAAFAGSFTGDAANPLETPEYFVRQQYVDVLGREPDEGGFNYWSDEILRCGNDVRCANVRRRDVAAAFFIEQEFQDTGSFIYALYQGSLGRKPVYAEYSSDRQRVVGGPNLDAEKTAFADSFVQRAEFVTKYQANTTPESFVDALLETVWESSKVDLAGKRSLLLAIYQTGSDTNQSRSRVLQDVIEDPSFKQAEYNPAFVLTEYFAYLRRDPDQGGYDFWLNVLNNREPGNFRGMVCSFITSTEYQKRFSSVVTRSNADCGQ